MKPEPDVLAFLGAAYAMLGRGHVRLYRRAGRLEVSLKPKSLRRAFEAEYAAQRGLWDFSRANRALRADLAARAAAAAESPVSPRPPERKLHAQKAAVIAALLAEDGGRAPDPLGIRTPWSELRKGAA